ncbi:MAG TPA: glycosyltransferase [Solirubrobacteraceae bacterium]|nr:glycosyltransferase [Solirubrobacteraceae bacterium]
MDGARPEPSAATAGNQAAPAHRPRVLFICADPVGERMAGLGIRCWELARALSDRASVTIAHGGTEEIARDGVRTVAFRPHAPGALRGEIAAADTIVAHPQWPLVNRWLRSASARVVIDLYCPETLETLELLADGGAGSRASLSRRQRTATTLDRLHAALRTGHQFMCASETQRDLWLGAMLALRLIGPDAYDRDPSLRETIDLVPFGVPAEPPQANGAGGPAQANRAEGRREASGAGGPREAIPALGADSEIVLWNGGIWRWLDAETAIRAVAALIERRPNVHLVFMGGAADHPAAKASTEAARRLAGELGLLDSVVHFHERWTPYAERGAWLTQAACVISAHADHLETRFAYRTRLLDCFWAGVPAVCTSGDDLAERIEREDLGALAPPGDADALSAALERVLKRGRDAYAPVLRAAAQDQTWQRVSAPLARWIADPSPPVRPGDAAGVMRPPLPQRAREAAYLAGGRMLLARR